MIICTIQGQVYAQIPADSTSLSWWTNRQLLTFYFKNKPDVFNDAGRFYGRFQSCPHFVNINDTPVVTTLYKVSFHMAREKCGFFMFVFPP